MSKQEVKKEVSPREVSPRDIDKEPRGKSPEELKKERDHKMVKGIFRFHELPKGEMGFVFKKYFGDQLERYSMKDGEVYTVPYMVARHLNTNCSYPSYEYKNDEQGRPVTTITEKIRRCSFQSLEFSDVAEDHEGIGPAI